MLLLNPVEESGVADTLEYLPLEFGTYPAAEVSSNSATNETSVDELGDSNVRAAGNSNTESTFEWRE